MIRPLRKLALWFRRYEPGRTHRMVRTLALARWRAENARWSQAVIDHFFKGGPLPTPPPLPMWAFR